MTPARVVELMVAGAADAAVVRAGAEAGAADVLLFRAAAKGATAPAATMEALRTSLPRESQ